MTGGSVLRRLLVAALGGGLLLLAGCKAGPNYSRPEMTPPAQHRDGPAAEAQAASMADLPWWEVFGDKVLQDLVRESLANNLDVRTAAARVEEARALAGVSKSFLYPEVNAVGSYNAQHTSRTSDPPQDRNGERDFTNWNAGVSVSWEIDLFGRLRRTNEAAFARYLATEQGRRAVIVALVGDVASTYFSLRQLDRQLDIARETLRLNDQTVAYYKTRLTGNVSNRLEVDQAVANRAITASTIPDLERQIAVTENALSLLLGRPPGPIARGTLLEDLALPPQVPAGVPAQLLERRPDVVAAEQQLVAANADIGAARALFFPTISLTGFLGALSGELSNVLKTDATTWNITPGIFQPIFQAGRIRRNYDAAKARNEQALAQYRKAALAAYGDVANSLVSIQKLAAARTELESGVEALKDASKLSRSRYDAGLSSYIEILIADQSLFQQQLQLARTLGDQHRAVAQLYRALGGGWTTPEQEQHQPKPAEPAASGQK